MYKVFVKNIPIILSTSKNVGDRYTTKTLKQVNFKKIVNRIYDGEVLYLNLYHKTEDEIEKYLRKKLPVVEAAGGLVYNKKKKVLFIFRNSKWDLPKGKIEKGERKKDAAIREVEEETGVENLEITRFINKTYHVFKRNDEFRLKVTYWYEMTTDYKGKLIPQLNEGIKKVKWKNFEKTQKALTNSYENIKLLFPKEYLTTHPYDRIP
ncbi:MAG: NUDIX hydrolase [Flavobacteriales bacterium]